MALRPLNADDIFISYARLDASTYAAGLADELTKRGFSCFIDKLGTDPDRDLPESLRRKIRSSAMLVVVGSKLAYGRKTIRDEVAEFVSTGRAASVVPIDFGDTVYGSDWYEPIGGVAPEPELNPNALDDGNPSPSVLSRIEKQFNYRRRDERLRRITRRAVAVLVLLVIAIAAAALVAWQQLGRAAAATARAHEETRRAADATRDAQAAQEAARKAQDEADTARDEATKQRDEATRQKGVADKATQTATEKTRLANEAAHKAQEVTARADDEQRRAEHEATIADIRAGANRSLAYLRERPQEVGVSLSIALDALKTAERAGIRNADADAAVRESLALLPLRRSYVPLAFTRDIAFSPDGAYIGLGSDEGVLHVFQTAKSKSDGGAKSDARGLKEEVARMKHVNSIMAVAFSDDDRYVAAASSQPQPYSVGEREPYPLRVWLLRPSELIKESERRLGQVKPSGHRTVAELEGGVMAFSRVL